MTVWMVDRDVSYANFAVSQTQLVSKKLHLQWEQLMGTDDDELQEIEDEIGQLEKDLGIVEDEDEEDDEEESDEESGEYEIDETDEESDEDEGGEG